MTTFSRENAPQCLDCLWLFDATLTADPPLRCAAYPDGIPDPIADGTIGHNELRGDEDIPLAFEPKD